MIMDRTFLPLMKAAKRLALACALVCAALGGISRGQDLPSQSLAVPASVPKPPEPSGSPAEATAIDPASLLPNLPTLPRRKTSLIGGTITKLDRIRDQFTLQIFGGGRMKIFFDPRTRIFSDGNEVTASGLRQGDRVSVDTVLEGSAIFARNIRLKSAAAGEGQGAVVSYQAGNGELIIRDVLSPHTLRLRVTAQTRFLESGHPAPASQLVSGTLVEVKFGSQKDGYNIAQQISVLAAPGSNFTFAGHISALDLSAGLLVLTSATDGKTYEIYLDPATLASTNEDNLRPAAAVTVLTRFDGNRYVAQSVTVN